MMYTNQLESRPGSHPPCAPISDLDLGHLDEGAYLHALVATTAAGYGATGTAGSAELVGSDLHEKLHRHPLLPLLPKTSVVTRAGPQSGPAVGPEGSEHEGAMASYSVL